MTENEDIVDTGEVPGFDASVATGAVIRKYMDSALGDFSPDDMFAIATGIAADPAALGDALGMKPGSADLLDPVVLRDRLMDTYYSQTAVDDMVRTIEGSEARADALKNARYESMMRHSGATPEQIERMRFDSANGDGSAMNSVRETFFFE